MSPQTFTLSLCTPSDVPSIVPVYRRSFSNDYFGSFTFPFEAIGDEEMRRWLTIRFSKYFSKREVRTIKITEDSTGQLVSFLRFTVPHVLTDEEKEEREKEKVGGERLREETGRDDRWPRGANLEICDEKFGGLDRLRGKYVDEKETYDVNLLATDPVYQRKGLASRLLKHVTDMADQEGRKVYIEATTAGYPVYLKLGFKEIDMIKVDLSKWGGKEIGTNVIMMRDPQVLTVS